MVTAVDDSATPNPTRTLSSHGHPSGQEQSRMTAVAMAICRPVTMKENLMTERKFETSSSMPMLNRRSSTPSSARKLICSRSSTNPITEGPRTTPARM